MAKRERSITSDKKMAVVHDLFMLPVWLGRVPWGELDRWEGSAFSQSEV